MMLDLTTKAITGVSWSIAQRLTSQALQSIVFLFVARLLGPGSFGLLALALVFVGLMQILVEQGFGDAIIQRGTLDATWLDTAFWTGVLSGVLCCGLGVALAPWVALVFSQPKLAPIIRWLSLLFLFNGLTMVPQALLRRALDFKPLALSSITQSLVGGVVAVVMAWRGFGVWSLVGQQLAAAFVGLVILSLVTHWRPRFQFSTHSLRELARFGCHITGVNLLNVVNRQGDNLVIGYFLGPVALGYYTIAYQLLITLSNFLIGTVNSVSLPLFSRLQGSHRDLRELLQRLTRLTCAISAPIFIGLALFAPDVITLCLGPKWQPSVPALQVLCLIGFLYAGFYFHGPLLSALGRPQWNLYLNAVQAVTNCAAFLIGVRWGIVGVAAAYVLRAYLTSPLHFLVLRRALGLQPLTYLKEFLPAIAASSVMALAILALKLLFPVASSPIALAIGVPLGGATYGLILLALQPETRDDLESLWQHLRQRPATPGPTLAPVH